MTASGKIKLRLQAATLWNQSRKAARATKHSMLYLGTPWLLACFQSAPYYPLGVLMSVVFIQHGEDSDNFTKISSVIQVFIDALPDIPVHRQLPLFEKLLTTLQPTENFLYMALILLFGHVVDKHDKRSVLVDTGDSLNVSSIIVSAFFCCPVSFYYYHYHFFGILGCWQRTQAAARWIWLALMSQVPGCCSARDVQQNHSLSCYSSWDKR